MNSNSNFEKVTPRQTDTDRQTDIELYINRYRMMGFIPGSYGQCTSRESATTILNSGNFISNRRYGFFKPWKFHQRICGRWQEGEMFSSEA